MRAYLSSDVWSGEISATGVWRKAAALGLLNRDYGQTWFVYESKRDYVEGLS